MNLNKTLKIGRYSIPLAVFFAVALASAGFAAVLLGQVSVSVPVTEALSITSPTTVTLTDVQPNEDHTVAVDIQNVASADNKALLTWVEDGNPSAVSYTVNFDTNPLVIAGSTTGTVTATFHIASDSPVGTVDGHFTVERVAV